MKLLRRSLFLLLVSFFAFSCSKNSNEGRIVVRLTDSPGDYDAVNIDLVGVQIHRFGGNQESGWIDLDVNAGIYNLLDLTGGVETVIADSKIPAGDITQMRLVLGENNSVEIDGQEIELKTPSAQQSGLKLLIDETLLEGITYSVLLDFDAAKSIVKAGASGIYNLKPVIRTVTEARDGAIEGTVLPAEENVAVYAIIGEDTLGTSYATENSSAFFIGGLEEGTYILAFDPGDLSTYDKKSITDVQVTLGVINNVGETTLDLK